MEHVEAEVLKECRKREFMKQDLIQGLCSANSETAVPSCFSPFTTSSLRHIL